jgi:NAD(P) transhydrogenase subunit alpha
VITHHGVTVIGYVDLPSRLAPTASQLYGSNLTHLLADMGGAKSWHVDLDDPVVRGALVLHAGKLVWPPPKSAPLNLPPVPKTPSVAAPSPVAKVAPASSPLRGILFVSAAALLLGLLGLVVPKEFVSHLTVFVLACFVGWQVVWNVAPALHTPLMSVTNAISGIILVGGMLQISGPISSPVTVLSAVAVLLATINITGGFWVTTRMLRMFQR